MFYINELSFLCDFLKKNFIHTAVLSPEDSMAKVWEGFFSPALGIINLSEGTVGENVGKIEPFTLYKSTDTLGIVYMYMLLPDNDKTSVFLIGPMLGYSLDSRQILELAEKSGVLPKDQHLYNEIYKNIPVIPENSSIYIAVDTFCERMWRNASFAVVDVQNEWRCPVSPINNTVGDGGDAALLSMKAMEHRYEYENELMQAVTLGQNHKADLFLGRFSEKDIEKRTPDALRNAKNYCIITNTLLRKAAENGGVHPIYLDKVSSNFAVSIEQLSSASDCKTLMNEMFKSYCRLVRKHSMKEYSPIVQKTIVIIESD